GSMPRTKRSGVRGSLLFFVIIPFQIYGPDVFFGLNPLVNIFNSSHSGQHRMVLVVVAMHAVAADEEEVVEFVPVRASFVELTVSAEVGGVRLGHFYNSAVDHVLWVN